MCLQNVFNLFKVKGRKQGGRCGLTMKIDLAMKIFCPGTGEKAS